MDNDLISRQAAIDVADAVWSVTGDKNVAKVWDQIKDLPSAERRGRWIENEFGAYCSECGLYAYRSNGIPWKSNYCPMCGARMEALKYE